jgi:hypothetical protein
MDITSIFYEVAEQMRSDVDRARKALSHSGLKGAAFEETFRRFLREYLPQSLDISTGQIVDSQGGFSRQLDVIISDTVKTPILFRSEDLRVIPVECVYTVIEVKAFLDKEELKKVFVNMESVRALQKRAYNAENSVIKRHVEMYGQNWDIWPTNYYVFAYDSISLEALTLAMYEINSSKNYPLSSRVDMVCVLDKGVIMNLLNDGNYYYNAKSVIAWPVQPDAWADDQGTVAVFGLLARRLRQDW